LVEDIAQAVDLIVITASKNVRGYMEDPMVRAAVSTLRFAI